MIVKKVDCNNYIMRDGNYYTFIVCGWFCGSGKCKSDTEAIKHFDMLVLEKY